MVEKKKSNKKVAAEDAPKKEIEVVAEEDTPVIVATEDSEDVEDIPVAPEEAKKSEQVAIKARVHTFDVDAWHPKTDIGRKVKSGEVTSLGDILSLGTRVLEPEVTEFLLQGMETDLLLIGQAKGKFGGGQRRVFRQCQKKTREGNKPSFSTCAVVGNGNGFVGIGYGKARETVPAREKALRSAKQNVIQIRRGSGSWEGAGENPDSIPFKVTGKCGSVEMTLMPAPSGTGLCIEKECAKILKLAGVKDVWSKTKGQSKTKLNQVKACFEALKNLSSTKLKAADKERFNIVEGQNVN